MELYACSWRIRHSTAEEINNNNKKGLPLPSTILYESNISSVTCQKMSFLEISISGQVKVLQNNPPLQNNILSWARCMKTFPSPGSNRHLPPPSAFSPSPFHTGEEGCSSFLHHKRRKTFSSNIPFFFFMTSLIKA